MSNALPEGARRPRHVRPEVSEKVAEAIRIRVASDPHRALQEAQRWHEQARQEKKLSSEHRRRSQWAKFRFDEFKRNLEAMGIVVIIESLDRSPTSEGDASERSRREGS